MGRLVVVTSGKGGVGKSTVAIGLASAFDSFGKSVLLVDADEGLRCLDLLLSVSNKLVFDLSDILNNKIEIDKAVNKVESADNIYLLAAPANPSCINGGDFCNLINDLSEKYDYVIVDCPAGIDSKYYTGLSPSALFIIVTNQDAVSIRNANKMTALLTNFEFKNKRLVINKFEKSLAKKFKITIDDVIDDIGAQLLAIIPVDAEIKYSAANGKLIKLGHAGMAFHRAAARIEGVNVPLPKITRI